MIYNDLSFLVIVVIDQQNYTELVIEPSEHLQKLGESPEAGPPL